MSRRIGETLVQAGKITEAQLHRALTAQLMFGGHLGTTLLELGCLDEETLGQTLSSIFGVPYADFQLLSGIPPDAVRCVPPRLVAKHSVVPLRVAGRTLHLAMIDPRNLIALDEVAFVTGYRLVPWVSPEVRILETLERYYGLQRSQRFVSLADELSSLASPRERLRPAEGEAYSARSEAAPRRALGVVASSGRLETAATDVAGPTAAQPIPDHWEKYGYGRSWQDVAQSIAGEVPETVGDEEVETRPQPRAAPRLGQVPPEPHAAPPSLMGASRRLASAASVEEIVSTTLAYAAARLSRCVFFVVKGGEAVGWAGRGRDISDAAVAALRIPLGPQHDDSIFSLVGDRGNHFLGEMRQSRGIVGFYAQLGVPAPRTALIVPLDVKGRRSAFLYADGGDREILAIDLPSMLALCARTALALQIIILRNKILSI